MEEAKTLERSLEELLGVGGAGCWESCQGNRGDLMRSWGHNLRKPRYKPGEVKSGTMPREKSEGVIGTVDHRDNITR